jgi:hypothetical protein
VPTGGDGTAGGDETSGDVTMGEDETAGETRHQEM